MSSFTADTTGLTGLVCGITVPPAIYNLTSCCTSAASWRVKDNVTQFCEVQSPGDFQACVNERPNRDDSTPCRTKYGGACEYRSTCVNAAAPSSSSCIPQAIDSFNTSGLSGLVCGISAPPTVHNISSCCITNTWNVQANCTQYCEARDSGEFHDCVNRDSTFLINSGMSNSSTSPIYNSLCVNASGSEGGDGEGKWWFVPRSQTRVWFIY